MDMLISENSRDDRVVSSYVSFKIKKQHRTDAVDSTGFNLNNMNLWRRNK